MTPMLPPAKFLVIQMVLFTPIRGSSKTPWWPHWTGVDKLPCTYLPLKTSPWNPTWLEFLWNPGQGLGLWHPLCKCNCRVRDQFHFVALQCWSPDREWMADPGGGNFGMERSHETTPCYASSKAIEQHPCVLMQNQYKLCKQQQIVTSPSDNWI